MRLNNWLVIITLLRKDFKQSVLNLQTLLTEANMNNIIFSNCRNV